MKVLVTGAAGFVGRPLCRRLVTDGHEVVAATRTAAALGVGVENVAVGDLRRMETWPMLDGCDAVVHLAAHVHRMKVTGEDDRLFREVNVDATNRLVREARARGVRRFVHLSTVKVHGESSGSKPLVETSPIDPRDAYARSKAVAEAAVAGSGVPNIILRPPLVYGPGVGANFRRLVDAVARSRPLPVGRIDNRRSLLYVENLVDAIAACLGSTDTGSRVYLLKDGEDVSSPDLVRRIASALGVETRLLSVPVGLLRIGGVLAGRKAAVDRLATSLQLDDTLIMSELHWTPPYTLDEGLRQTVAAMHPEVNG